MGCNCSKNRAQPTGFMGTQRQDAQRAAANQPQQAPKPPAPATNTDGATQQFVLTDRSGKTQSFSRRLDAEAAKVRAGGGTIKPR